MSRYDDEVQCDLEAEKALLGTCLVYEHSDADVKPTDFWASEHADIWCIMKALEGQGRRPTPVEVQMAARQSGKRSLSQALLDILENSPVVGDLEPVADRLRSLSQVRAVRRVAEQTVAEARGALKEPQEWLSGVEERFWGVGHQSEKKLTLGQEAMEVVNASVNGENPGINTGYRFVDGRVGGLKVGELHLVAGRPGHGKTALALQMLRGLCDRGASCVFVSLEMSTRQLVTRLLSAESKVPGQVIENGRMGPQQVQAVTDSVSAVDDLPLSIIDDGAYTVGDIAGKARRAFADLAKKHGKRPMVLAVDYVQLMNSGNSGNAGNLSANENFELTAISKGLKQLARGLGCPIIVLSQLNRSIESREDKRPKMSDLRGSGSLEQDAYSIHMLYREDCYRDEQDGRAEVITVKCRGGQAGSDTLDFIPELTMFSEPGGYDWGA